MLRVQRLCIILLVLGLGSCTKLCSKSHEDLDPVEVVEQYLDIALNMTSLEQRDDLLQFTTGALHESIAKASDETLTEAYINKSYKLNRYSVVERRDRTPRETEITFELVYREFTKDDKTPKEAIPLISTENTVSVVRENNLWLIKDVLNKKSTFDFPVTGASEIKAKAR